MICLFSTSFSHGSNLSNLVRILFKLRDKLSQTTSPKHGSGWYIPRRRISFRTAGSCLSRVHQHRRLSAACLWLAAPAVLFPSSETGVYPPEVHPFPWLEKGGGLGWIWTEVYLWTLPTVPMSAWWKRSPMQKHPYRRRHRKDRLVRGVLIGGGLPVFSVTGNALKSRADVWPFSPKKRPVCKGFRQRFWWW